jgi:hypothetical protein
MEEMLKKYGRTSTERIREVLERVKPVVMGNKGVGSIHGYYGLSEEKLAELKKKPRKIAYTFSIGELGTYVPDLKEYRTIDFYVKSSSRFFLKPDIGEVIDQMTEEDLKNTDAIHIVQGSERMANNEGDHFVMTAVLLQQEKK